MLRDILLAFIPMFFAMDPLGLLVVFPGLTQGLTAPASRQVIVRSMWTASLLATGFIFLGKSILNFLGVGIGDFMVAGGAVLFSLAMVDLLSTGTVSRRHGGLDLGVVPFGTPLIVGPAVLTMALILMGHFGWAVTLTAVLLNIALSGMVLWNADRLVRLLGQGGARGLSMVMYLLLAAIGVMMVRKGIAEMAVNWR